MLMRSQVAAPRAAAARAVARAPLALPKTRRTVQPARAIDLDFSDPDTQLGLAGVVLGLVAGIGAPIWYINRVEKDEERLEELRAINRATFQETGEYLSENDIVKFRKPKWTDKKEFVDDD